MQRTFPLQRNYVDDRPASHHWSRYIEQNVKDAFQHRAALQDAVAARIATHGNLKMQRAAKVKGKDLFVCICGLEHMTE